MKFVESHLSGSGRIYVIQGLKDSPVKIGFCRDRIPQRLAALQLANPHPLRVVTTARGSMLDERRIHASLDAERMVGEWFDWLPRTIAFVTHLSRHQDVTAALAAIGEQPQIAGDWDRLLIAEGNICEAFCLKGQDRRAITKLRAAPEIAQATERYSPTGRKLAKYYVLSEIKRWLTSNQIPHALSPMAGRFMRHRDGFVMANPEASPKQV